MAHALTKKPKVIFCDIDKTLVSNDAWYELTSSLHGDVEVHYQVYTSFTKGQMTFEEMKKKLFEMWNHGYGGPIPRRVIQDVFFKIQLRGEAFSFFTDLKKKNYPICLISSYMDLFVEQVASRVQIDDWYANAKFIFDENNYWIDYSQDIDEGLYKVKVVEQYLKGHNIQVDECVVLGGGPEEIELFRRYPGIAVNTENQELINLAWEVIKYPPTVLQILNRFE